MIPAEKFNANLLGNYSNEPKKKKSRVTEAVFSIFVQHYQSLCNSYFKIYKKVKVSALNFVLSRRIALLMRWDY